MNRSKRYQRVLSLIAFDIDLYEIDAGQIEAIDCFNRDTMLAGAGFDAAIVAVRRLGQRRDQSFPAFVASRPLAGQQAGHRLL